MKLPVLLYLAGFFPLAVCRGQVGESALFSVDRPKQTYALLIANETYQYTIDSFTTDVVQAIQETECFRQQLLTRYGVPKEHISFHCNTNAVQLKLAFAKLVKMASGCNGPVDLLIYYRGKYLENEKQRQLYFMPARTPGDGSLQLVNLDYFLTKLEGVAAHEITLLIDGEQPRLARKASVLKAGGSDFPILQPTLREYTHIYIAHQETKHYYPMDASSLDLPDKSPSASITDTSGPRLQILSYRLDEENLSSEATAFIQGTALDASGVYQVAINGQEAHTSPDGRFKGRISLQPGMNVLCIQAIDIHTNSRTARIRIRYNPPATGLSEPEVSLSNPPDVQLTNYAVLIGVNDYQDPALNNLTGPLRDVVRLQQVLITRYSFAANKVIVLKNPTRQEIIQTLDQLERTLTDSDNLLVYYAGHGTWDERVQKGYWLPADAHMDNTANWIRNTTISGYISGIASRNTLLISDACFSGGIFKTQVFQEDLTSSPDRSTQRSRKAMTSGSLSEVPDQSVFSELLVAELQNNTLHRLTASQLFESFKPEAVSRSSIIPQFGTLKNTGDEGGDFVFIQTNSM